MATRGIKQLKALQIVYCEHGGSSSNIRQYLSSPTSKIVSFCTNNPTVQVSTKLRNGKHPYIKAEYVSGFSKQVCIKNEELDRIQKVVHMLNNSSGRKITKIGGPIRTQTPSIQGVWTPMLDIAGKSFEIEMIEN
jgi:large subunit ribosomal protein L43|eukprot:9506_1